MSLKLKFFFQTPLYFKAFAISVLFFKTNPFINSLSIMTKMTLITAIWGAALTFENILICFRRIKTLYFLLFALFAISYSVTIVINIGPELLKNVQDLVWFIISVFYLMGSSVTREENQQEYWNLLKIFLCYSFLFAAVSVPFVFLNMGGSADWGRWGFYSNRLFGVYRSPNYGSLYCSVSLAVSLYMLSTDRFNNTKLHRSFFIINSVFQVLYIIYSGSNTGKVTLTVGLAMFLVYLVAIKRIFIKKGFVLLMVALVVVLVPFMFYTVRTVTTWIVTSYNRSSPDISTQTVELQGSNVLTGHDVVKINKLPSENLDDASSSVIEYKNISLNMSFSLDRADTQKYGLANGRLHNWRVGLTVFKNYPFFGTSMREYANIAKGYDSSWRTQSRTATLENDFISLLACTGVVGTLFFIAAASVVLFRIIRCLIKKIKRIMVGE